MYDQSNYGLQLAVPQQGGYDMMSGWGSPTDTSTSFAPIDLSGYGQPAATPASNPMFGGFLGTKNADGSATQGWGAPAVGVASGLFNAWMGMKQYGLAKQQLAANKQQFNLNYDAQRTATNTELQDRQAARVASNPGAYQSVGDYMAQHAIKPMSGG